MREMKAVRISAFGGPQVLQLEQIATPQPAAGEMLVKIHAASVNPVDYKIRSGKYPAVTADMLPYVLGRDVAGEVVRCGPGVSGFSEGDAIYAVVGIDRGGYAQYVIVKPSEAAFAPRTADFVSAAAVPLAGLTAWQGLFRHGGVSAGERVLIHGGSGGVGHFAVQFAKAKGAFVVTTVSSGNATFAGELGADQVVDYETERFEHAIEPVDMVFDLIGGETQDRSWTVLKRGGVLVSTLNAPSQQKARAHDARALRYTVEECGSELSQIAELIDSGKVRAVVSKEFDLPHAAAALREVEQGHTRGKVVLTVP